MQYFITVLINVISNYEIITLDDPEVKQTSLFTDLKKIFYENWNKIKILFLNLDIRKRYCMYVRSTNLSTDLSKI